MNVKTITLEHPVTVGGEVVTELNLRRPKLKDLRQLDEISGEIAVSEAIINSLSDASPAVVANLDAADFAKINEVLAVFFVGLLPTGGK